MTSVEQVKDSRLVTMTMCAKRVEPLTVQKSLMLLRVLLHNIHQTLPRSIDNDQHYREQTHNCRDSQGEGLEPSPQSDQQDPRPRRRRAHAMPGAIAQQAKP